MKNKYISFLNLSEQDFPLLLKWLETPHVKTWWDNEVVWTLDEITQKYSSYVNQRQFDIEFPNKQAASLSINSKMVFWVAMHMQLYLTIN